jgi:polyisoprenoid-binding protein YceI
MTETDASPRPADAIRAGRWLLDPAGSSVQFRQRTMWGLVNVKGAYSDVRGEGEVDGDGAVTGQVKVATASIDTNHAKRDAHLRSADFFDVDRHPVLTATIRRATLGEGIAVSVGGQLEVVGQPTPLAFTGGLTEVTPDAVTIEAETSFDREAVGIGWNKLGMMRGPTTVEVKLRFVRQPG